MCLAMLDFVNAYGSLQWKGKLSHLGFANSYSVITTESYFHGHKNWSTDFFGFKIRLYQGCCVSVMILNSVSWPQWIFQKKKNWVRFQECSNNFRRSKFCWRHNSCSIRCKWVSTIYKHNARNWTWTKTTSFKASKYRSWAETFFINGGKPKFKKL